MSKTQETRRESYLAILPTLAQRQKTVLQILKDYGEMTAQEVADSLFLMNITPTNERNFAAPRLTELCDMGLAEAIGKKVCGKTGRTVSIWSATDKAKKNGLEPTDDATPLRIELSVKIWLNSLERGGGKPKQVKQGGV
ncbi:MAG: hypothetical protein LBQ48_04270 [Oscillospiraceae bacterium]|jgi:predicted ArsR family transcriptional regulator|nr:hypothetical protein [Oscillospiraceae bacterium]